MGPQTYRGEAEIYERSNAIGMLNVRDYAVDQRSNMETRVETAAYLRLSTPPNDRSKNFIETPQQAGDRRAGDKILMAQTWLRNCLQNAQQSGPRRVEKGNNGSAKALLDLAVVQRKGTDVIFSQ